MLSKEEIKRAQLSASLMLKNAGIKVNDIEVAEIEVADFGLGDLRSEGAEILTLVNTERIGAKIITLFNKQTLPEHWHPPVDNDPGKEETVRVIEGQLRVYISGEETLYEGFIPRDKENYYTSRQECILEEGEQMILEPGTKHWFQAGEGGSVFYSFSTTVRDAKDKFSDPKVNR